MPHTAEPSRVRKFWREYRGIVVFFVFMLGFRSAWADWVLVPTGSMNPTILEGDRVLVDKHIFGLRIPFTLTRLTQGENPRRGDIVVFDSPVDGTSLVKRVVGIPGDIVELDGETLIVNGQRSRYFLGDATHLQGLLDATRRQQPVVLRETGAIRAHDMLVLPARESFARFGPIRIPEGRYFMLGDNRDNSADSRYIGFVPRRNIVGKATRVVVSLNPDRHYLPRAHRLLTPLS